MPVSRARLLSRSSESMSLKIISFSSHCHKKCGSVTLTIKKSMLERWSMITQVTIQQSMCPICVTKNLRKFSVYSRNPLFSSSNPLTWLRMDIAQEFSCLSAFGQSSHISYINPSFSSLPRFSAFFCSNNAKLMNLRLLKKCECWWAKSENADKKKWACWWEKVRMLIRKSENADEKKWECWWE